MVHGHFLSPTPVVQETVAALTAGMTVVHLPQTHHAVHLPRAARPMLTHVTHVTTRPRHPLPQLHPQPQPQLLDPRAVAASQLVASARMGLRNLPAQVPEVPTSGTT